MKQLVKLQWQLKMEALGICMQNVERCNIHRQTEFNLDFRNKLDAAWPCLRHHGCKEFNSCLINPVKEN